MGHQDKLHTFVSKSTQANIARSKAVFSRFSSVVIRHASLPSRLYTIIWRHAMVFHSWPAGSSLPARPFSELQFYERLWQVLQVRECESCVGRLCTFDSVESAQMQNVKQRDFYWRLTAGRLPVTLLRRPRIQNMAVVLWLLCQQDWEQVLLNERDYLRGVPFVVERTM